MTGVNWIALAFVIVTILATIGLGIYATGMAKSASDFFVAGRGVNVFWNASAISGEYLSAASFMGIAGLIMKNGYDALWYPVGYATGYLFLLLFIAGPLRRFGAYTIPDFAEGRFNSPWMRKIAVIVVLLIGFFYTMPQMKAAGVTLGAILAWPYWAGIVVVGAVITFNVALGGMKGITFVQGFQYWLKVFAISVPIFILCSVFGGYNSTLGAALDEPKEVPRVDRDTPLQFKGKVSAPANAVSFSSVGPTTLLFPKGAHILKVSPVRKPQPGEAPMPAQDYPSTGTLPDGSNGYVIPPGGAYTARPWTVVKDGKPVMKDGWPLLTAPKIEFYDPTAAILKEGALAPNAPPNGKWIAPFGPMTSKYDNPLLYTYSLIIALVCGTAGLPHILVRFYTNPDGRSAKRTTLWVMVLIGVFYLFPAVWGVLGRANLPAMYANNSTDLAVIKLPTALPNKLLGQILSGITSAGAFAAFMSTFSGLLVSMSSALAHDIYGKMIRPHATSDERTAAFKVSAVLLGAIAILLGLRIESFDIAMLVGWAFAIAAASYFPLLLLGSWWRGLTRHGAAAGMLVGGLLSLGAIACTMFADLKWITLDVSPFVRTLMEQPAIWGVPLSIATMVIVSLATQGALPKDVDTKMLRLHAPEELGLSKNYIEH
ncbi:MAG TPA: cation acetate symporter [Stellaceae bacterium]|nr:cation acetate symporter [Stellaceae bacterium]